jgi:hypothetical protein
MSQLYEPNCDRFLVEGSLLSKIVFACCANHLRRARDEV